ncbi:secretin and TonB N-terminal domain-containing protein [Roseateles flavus]|uniref:Secretin and TonB N-terminal domain-containing protein n=1 Tax=Roseateles flavus TaxID=3149041 RepID=A0ABV0GKY8_9BURK
MTVVAAAAVLTGCSGYRAYREGQADLAEGKVQAGLTKLKEASEQDPGNVEYRRSYFTERESATNALMRRADQAMGSGDFDDAQQAYAQVLAIDPANARATAGTVRVADAQRHWAILDGAQDLARKGDVETALSRTQQVLSENSNNARATALYRQLSRQQADKTGKELGIYPRLKETYRKPVSLNFSGASLQQVFEALKQASGLNYVIDKDVRVDQRVTLSVTAKPVEDILRLLLATNQLERRVLDEDTLLIYPNTPAKQAEYREMIVRTFYLSNAEASKVATLVRTIARARDVVVDEKLNTLVVRDSAEVVRLVEKLVATQDVAEPEVMLELEVLEVSVNRLLEMGVTWPSSVSATLSGAAGAGQLTLNEWRHRGADMVKLNVGNPMAAAQLRSQVGSANLLANPRVRVRNRQSAKILIGERVPVFTTVATANVGTAESVNYLDVGLKLDIEPTVSVDNDVSMKLSLEVSNIIETISRASGAQAYRIGTRNTSTALRVRDGETNILAGLIKRDEQRSNTGVPGLNEIPLLSKLFGGSRDNDSRTEIVLLVTPHIVRNIEPPGLGLQEFMSGTDAAAGAAPIQLGTPAPSSQAPTRVEQINPFPGRPVMTPNAPILPPRNAPALPPGGQGAAVPGQTSGTVPSTSTRSSFVP